MRNNRKNSELRPIEIIPNYLKNADGSCLIKFGNTQVIVLRLLTQRYQGG